MNRRDFLKSVVALISGLFHFDPITSACGAKIALGNPQTFDFSWLKGRARTLAGAPFRLVRNRFPKSLADLSWDEYQSIRFFPACALWIKEGLEFRIQFFHLGRSFNEPVRMYEVVGGQAKAIPYQSTMFDLAKSGLDVQSLPEELGFAGFKVNFHTNWQNDVAAFLGASYFRAVGEDDRQYGISARALAIDTALGRAEEFPRFIAFWFARPPKDSQTLTVYALLDSESVAGAYRFDIMPGATMVMAVDAALYPRRPIERLGIAPLTTMFLYGENDRRVAHDWRPEIHDSDGLSLCTGGGEWIWRPLVNPAGARVNSFADENPRGFGLLQRDRNFDHYQDDGAFYNRRPSVWVEPKRLSTGGWGKGAVQLVELPAPDETFDNVVAFWNPVDKPQPGQELLFSYRVYWGSRMPVSSPLAHVVATRTGLGGVVGQRRKYFSWRFAIDFIGGELATLAKKAKVEPVINASRGTIEITSARPQSEIHGYRAMFDLRPDDSIEPIDLRLYLRLDGQPLSETWLYQWTPPPLAERKY